MAAESPAMRRVQVAEHPRLGRGDAGLWDLVGWLGDVRVHSIWLLLWGAAFGPGEQVQPLGFYKDTWLGLQKRSHRTYYHGLYVFCFIHADSCFPFLAVISALFLLGFSRNAQIHTELLSLSYMPVDTAF